MSGFESVDEIEYYFIRGFTRYDHRDSTLEMAKRAFLELWDEYIHIDPYDMHATRREDGKIELNGMQFPGELTIVEVSDHIRTHTAILRMLTEEYYQQQLGFKEMYENE